MSNFIIQEDNSLKSQHFNDIYYNVDGGLDEKKYVFIDANELPHKFKNLENDFNILELGFGTGLSFILTAIEYSKYNLNYNLNFTSTELYPLTYSHVNDSLKNWEDIYGLDIVQNFLNQYMQADLTKDIIIKLNNITLKILVGDAQNSLKKLNDMQDCFYLDGFTPSKNPIMWGETVFTEIKRLAKPKSTASTYSVCRVVKDILTFADFSYYKQKGFGKKRHMIVGIKK